MDLSLTTTFVALFTIVNPIGNIPLFLGLTCDQSPREQKHTVIVASAAVLIILLIAFFLGQRILDLFGINLDAFRLAGQLVIASLAWSMLNAKSSPMRHTAEEGQDAEQKASIAVVPLATPILAGAGALSLVISYASSASNLSRMIEGSVVIMMVTATTALILLAATRIQDVLGVSGMNILTRIFGLLLLAIAVGDAAKALISLFPALGS